MDQLHIWNPHVYVDPNISAISELLGFPKTLGPRWAGGPPAARCMYVPPGALSADQMYVCM